MEIAESIELTKLLLLVVLLTLCSATDLKLRRVPNAVLLPALMAALFLNTLAGGFAGFADSVGGLLMGLLMLLPMHIYGRMGAGDVKLLGVVGSVLGTWGAIVAGFATLLAGGVVGIVYMAWLFAKPALTAGIQTILQFRSGSRVGNPGTPTTIQAARAAEIPYAIAVAAGTIIALEYLGLMSEARII